MPLDPMMGLNTVNYGGASKISAFSLGILCHIIVISEPWIINFISERIKTNNSLETHKFMRLKYIP